MLVWWRPLCVQQIVERLWNRIPEPREKKPFPNGALVWLCLGVFSCLLTVYWHDPFDTVSLCFCLCRSSFCVSGCKADYLSDINVLSMSLDRVVHSEFKSSDWQFHIMNHTGPGLIRPVGKNVISIAILKLVCITFIPGVLKIWHE